MRAPPRAIPNETISAVALVQSQKRKSACGRSSAASDMLHYDLLHYVAKHTARFSGRAHDPTSIEDGQNRNQEQEDDRHDH
jgi:hypothetical protein